MATERAPGEVALDLPLGLTAQDLAELDAGAWKEVVESDAPPSRREFLLWGLEHRKPKAFERSDAWEAWISSKGLEWLLRRLESSIEAFDALAASELTRQEESSWAARRNLRWLAARLGRPQEEADFLARLMMSLSDQVNRAGLAWFAQSHLLWESDLASMAESLGKACGWDQEASQAVALWDPQGAWAQAGVLWGRSSRKSLAQPRSYGRPDEFAKYLANQLFRVSRSMLETPWDEEAELMAHFYRPFAGGEGLTPTDWSHVGEEVGDIVAALSNSKVKVLLWGDPGTGKSSLAGALARACGLTAVQPSALEKKDNNGKSGDLGFERLLAVGAAERLARAVERPVVVVDECEPILTDDSHKIDTAQALEAREASQIWIANSLEKAHEAYLRRFDFILKVPAMTLAAREALARKLFGATPLAARLAQSMRNPAELVSAKRWCEAAGGESWAVVSRKMAGHQRAVSAASGEGQGHFEVVSPGSSKLALNDFAGNERMRQEIAAIAGFFADPSRYARLGAKIPKGYLLDGGPGSGKTWFARVLSSVAGVPMIVANGASLASRPESFAELFSEARKRAPCVAFVDEFDVVGTSARNADGTLNLERQKILNQFLVELDGFDPLEGVLFLAATHNGGSIDKAVTRAGRLGRSLSFGDPGPGERQEVWKAHLDAALAAAEVDWLRLEEASRGFSCAQIAEAAERAKLAEAGAGAEKVGMPALEKACDEVFWGEESQMHLTPQERWRTAVHEAGHALAALREGLRPQRATVRPRSRFLGAVSVMGEEGEVSRGPREIDAALRVALAGYAAEEGVFGEPSDGASADLASARRNATRALQDLALGRAPQAHQGSIDGGLMMSQRALEELEDLGRQKLDLALEQARELMSSERENLLSLAKELLDKRDLSRAEIELAAGKGGKDSRSGLSLAARGEGV